jgi:hypothetical protein
MLVSLQVSMPFDKFKGLRHMSKFDAARFLLKCNNWYEMIILDTGKM